MENNHPVLREIIELFVEPSRKARYLYFWEKSKRRAQLLDELLHDARDLRADRSRELVPTLSDPDQLLALMRKQGAGKTCYVFGRSTFDGEQADLRAALADVAGRMREVIVFARDTQLAFVEEHDGRQFILSMK
ncbi:hypothetical protein F2P45_32775 [Massilia sp. CCM 8733]|uniref:Uncharacterized protein n=1 Tax=Massilia mucilaginosa TaxID=2609282 RepID=A0ABX0P345_9BURK|nr:hypothetical protein [Massilia mucilaginosa]NHZ93738.1 hypothetical protein [Massilia mucilaginosa]